MRLRRPIPPPSLFEPSAFPRFERGAELEQWLVATFLDPSGPLANPDHAHLASAQIACLWSDQSPASKGRTVVATAEIVQPKGWGFGKARQEAFLGDLLGFEPDFLLTFSAGHAQACDDASFCALVEHELYHCAHALDEWGAPRFRRDGSPVFTIQGHDVEEFTGVVRRYGPGAAGREVEAFVAAAQAPPQVARASITASCGTCLKAAA